MEKDKLFLGKLKTQNVINGLSLIIIKIIVIFTYIMRQQFSSFSSYSSTSEQS